MASVCFDTNFMIWGIRRTASPGQEYCIDRARYVIERCQENGDKIIVPSIVLGELMVPIPDRDRGDFVRFMTAEGFIVMPFDSVAAVHFARMWASRPANTGFSRNEMKADFMIAGIALASGCQKIYSNDAGLVQFASPYLSVLTIDDIAPPPEQTTIFDE